MPEMRAQRTARANHAFRALSLHIALESRRQWRQKQLNNNDDSDDNLAFLCVSNHGHLSILAVKEAFPHLSAMEGRMRKCRQVSPERAKVWTEPSPKHHLLRGNVIDRLNVLRGRGMPSMYSWSCKRNYKNGFVWHDLSEDDLIIPAQGNEYVLKGSEILEDYHSGNESVRCLDQCKFKPVTARSQEASTSFSTMVERELKSSLEDETSPPPQRAGSAGMSPESIVGKNPSCGSSRSLMEYKVCSGDGATDASTQTDDRVKRSKARETCTRGVSTDDGSHDAEFNENDQNQNRQEKENLELCRGEISPPPSSSTSSSGGKTETLESLMKAEVSKMNNYRILEEGEIRIPSTHTRVKAMDVLMQLISCGSISVKDHSFGLIPTYRPRFPRSKFSSPFLSSSIMLGELDCFSENPRVMSLRLEDKEYFSGSLIEVKMHKQEGDGCVTLKRSSSYNADRSSKPSASTEDKDSGSTRSKCIPRSIKASLTKQPRSDTMKSPKSEGARNSSAGDASPLNASIASGTRIAEHSSSRKPSGRLDSFREEKEKAFFGRSGDHPIKDHMRRPLKKAL
ncbi:hypothetical protein Scep_015423 [Stephania cephalantha]|uniref:SOSEKI DIX-like domain-containing protein n=1 Tax=Stephania cephalantha TaxID=152367 RepID=A0AAP0P0C9_9MAGN